MGYKIGFPKFVMVSRIGFPLIIKGFLNRFPEIRRGFPLIIRELSNRFPKLCRGFPNRFPADYQGIIKSVSQTLSWFPESVSR
jgi:hypothetical protein